MKYTGNKLLVTCLQRRNLGTSKPQNGFFIMVLGTRLQGYDVTSRAFGFSDFPISDFCFRQSENTCHQFLGSDS